MANERDADGKRELISGIESDAEEEAGRLISQAEKEASERRDGASRRAESILREAGEKAAAQAEAAARKILSGIEVEVRRKLLQGQYRVLSEVLGNARARFRGMAESGRYEDADGRVLQYREILKNWIVEAVIGLGSERADVMVSALDRPYVDDSLLAETEQRVQSVAGMTVELAFDSGSAKDAAAQGTAGGPAETEPPRATEVPWDQGVTLTDRERRVAFNNRLESRIRRKERLIQAMIYDALLKGTA